MHRLANNMVAAPAVSWLFYKARAKRPDLSQEGVSSQGRGCPGSLGSGGALSYLSFVLLKVSGQKMFYPTDLTSCCGERFFSSAQET
jgi:hypothetical protein